ncbi:MAG: hypothetical protein ABSG78_16255, partial [Verrucomicrobiota bacterium]
MRTQILGFAVKQTLFCGALFLLSLVSAQAQVDLGKAQVSAIGHLFTQPFPPPAGAQSDVTDYLVDQRQVSGGGAVLPSVTADFDTHNQFVLTITAPPGQQFMVHVPDGQSVHLAALLDWQATNVSSYGPSAYGTTVVSFGNLYGTAPGYFAQSAVLSQLHGFFGFNDIQSLAITNDLAFTSVALTATVSETNVGAGVLNYTPSSDDAFVFYYATTQTNDPGPFLSIVPLPPPPPASTTNLVTFDDLPDQTSIPNGYAQLNWSGFEVITAIGDGYTSGLISPPNVAFNPYGYDASISSSIPFNLISAYLTAAVVPTMEVQVEGWVGTALVYDQTYGLSESSPTLVNLNYAGVTQVTFIGMDGSPFVMDNLTVSSPSFTNLPAPPPPPATNTAPGTTNLVTFDDLPDQTSIPNGYAQLNWSGFEVITAIGDGYTSGLISPP